MAFQSPILQGEELIRPAIRSQDYVEAVSGWRIGRGGAAETAELVNRGAFTTDSAQVETITLSGVDLQQQLDDDIQGIVAKYDWTTATETWIGAGPHRIVWIPATLPAGRYCKVEVNGLGLGSTVANDGVRGFLTYTIDGTVPIGSSTAPVSSLCNFPNIPVASDIQFGQITAWISNLTGTDQDIRIGLFAERYRGTGNVLVYSGKRAIITVTDQGLNVPNQGTKYVPAGTSVTDPTNFDKTWTFTSLRSFNEAGNVTIANGGDSIYAFQGDGDAVGNPGGNHCGYFFFNTADMVAQLAGATISATYVYLDNVHCYLNSGVTIRIGTHNHNPKPPGPTNRVENRWNAFCNKGGDVWTGSLGATLGNELRDGTSKGIVVGYGPANDINYYSYYNRCKIRIKYSK